ncbi:MAG: tRNA (adenosine(37)-N6)-dimethylallyltransferase MiaA, partial [Erysipelotrichaceae bacterium]
IQVYRQLSIGSAKVTFEEQEGIPHHLIDILSYEDGYSVRDFQKRARECIADIHSRGKLPIVCGGTGLYIKALLYDYVFHDEEVDVAYQEYLTSLTPQARYALLQERDPASAATIHPNNQQRVVRALMAENAGKRKSDTIAQQEGILLYDAYIVGLTMERAALYERINHRVQLMFEHGLVQEVEGLLRVENPFALQSMQGIGYKEFREYYEHRATVEEVAMAIAKHSRQFAKRQYTWFRNQMEVHWYDVQDPSFGLQLDQAVAEWSKHYEK